MTAFPRPALAFLDANVLYSAAYRSGTGLRRLWSLPDTALLSSHYAITEARRNLPIARHSDLDRLVAALLIVETPPPGTRSLPADLVLPPKDVPIFLAAAAARASHLLTGDKRHFGPYFGQRFDGVLILAPGAFLKGRP